MSLIEKYKLAFDISPVPMLLVSDEGTIMLANEGFLELFEYDADELTGMSVEVLVPPSIREHHPELRSAYNRVPTKRSMGAGRDLFGITKSKTVIPLELGLEPISDGFETMSLVVAIDIRERKLHEDRLQRALDASASAMVMVNRDGHIVFLNRAASELFGYEEVELMGERVEILVPEEFRRAHPVYIGSYMSERSTRSMGLGRDLYARRKDGSKFPVEISLTPVATPDGTMVMSTIIDLSERIAAAQEVARKNIELEAMNVELSHFAYSASHDLKAPLVSITGLLHLCIEDLDDGNVDEVQDNLKKVVEISARSAHKVEGILKIARAGRESVPHEPVVLLPLVDEIWLDLTGGNSLQHLEVKLDEDDELEVVTERPTLKVIIENLLSNALNYSDDHKDRQIISVDGRIEDGNLHFSVTDNGIGIAEAAQGEVFSMFKRLTERSGDGLGLSLVKKQLDRLGGTITFSSTEGEGTTFTFTLPKEQVRA